MKKLIGIFTMALAFFAFTSAIAQPPEGGGPGRFNPEQMKKHLKEQLIKDLNLADVQADTVVNIQFDVMKNMRGLRDLDQDAREAKMKELKVERNTRLEAAFPPDLATKVETYLDKMRPKREHNPGGEEPPHEDNN